MVRSDSRLGDLDLFVTKVRVTAAGHTQTKEFYVSPSYASGTLTELYFGLGFSERADAVEVRWPDGQTQTFADVPGRHVYRIPTGRRSGATLRRFSLRMLGSAESSAGRPRGRMCRMSPFLHVDESPQVEEVSRPGSPPDAAPTRDPLQSAAEILEAAPVGFARSTPEGRIRYANAAFARILGYDSAQEILSLDVARDIYANPRDRAVAVAQMNDATVLQRRELELRRKDGSTVWVEVQSRTVRDAEGCVLHFESFVSDITDRLRAESALKQSEERWRGIFENSRIGIALAGPEGRFVAVNARYQELVGYSEKELRGMSFLEITHPDDRAENQRLNADLKSGRRKNFQIEKRYRRKEGNWIWVRTTVFPVPSPDGTTRCEAALVEDITERKRAEEELRKSERQLRDAQAVAHFGSWEWNPREGSATWSDELYRIFGVPSSFRPGTESFLERVHPEDRERLREILHQSLEKHGGFPYEYRITRPDGSLRQIRSVSSVERDAAGSLVRVLGVAQDVTERARLENELKSSEAYLAEGQRLSHTGSWAWNVASGELFWSQETFRIVGADPATMRPSHRAFLEHIHSDDRSRVEEELDRALGDRADFDSRYRIRRSDGSIAHLHSLGHPAFHAAGELVEYVGVVVDETDRYLAGERLDRSLQELRALSSRLQTIREEEARRIAREVHDEVGQTLTALHLDVAWLEKRLTSSVIGAAEEFRAKLQSMAGLIDTTLGAVQRISSELRPGILDELGLEAAIEWYVQEFEKRTEIACRLESHLDGARVDPNCA
ncbi:MAG TPA: PAS domain S-box protein, partial [Thermoanaerobaculia bacterium]|nr:PAS domain S-box protein [Thermoanaerobaculia bacterium]